jgi:hypothetical protein
MHVLSTCTCAGEIVNENGVDYHAFDSSSNATLFTEALHNFTTVYPCYSLNSSGGVTSGVPSYTGRFEDLLANDSAAGGGGRCSMVWVTDGWSVRDNCLTALSEQATPWQAYLAGYHQQTSVPGFYDWLMGCSGLLQRGGGTRLPLSGVFVEQSRSLNTFLDTDDAAHGAFFPTTSASDWVEDSRHFSTQLQMSNMLDQHSRAFIVYIILRNLNDDGLFYTLLKMTFNINIQGAATVSLDTTFSPMIDYSYGTNDHEWVRVSALQKGEVAGRVIMIIMIIIIIILR